jgi:carbamoyltransferase
MTMKNQVILGINWEQNSTASLMISGKIVGCSSEERFTRIKNDERYPKNAIDWLLKTFKIKKNQINYVCFISKIWSPSYSLVRHYTSFSIEDYIKEQNEIWYPKLYKNKKNVSILKTFKNKIDYSQFPGEKYWKLNLKKQHLML